MASGLAAFCLLVVCFCSTEPAAASVNTCGVQKNEGDTIEPSLIGGHDVEDPMRWPWMVSVSEGFEYFNYHVCGGALIHPKWVLTAAHCLPSRLTKFTLVILGSTNLRQEEPQRQYRKIANLKSHESYESRETTIKTVKYDIGLIELAEPVELNDYIRPICLPSSDWQPYTNCYHTGWGIQDWDAPYPRGSGKILQENEAYIVPSQECLSEWTYHATKARNTDEDDPEILGEQLAAGTTFCVHGEETSRMCNGDSGGPLMCEQNGHWVVAGIVSWGFRKCPEFGPPGLFVNVRHFLPWIKRTCGGCVV